MTPAFSRRFHRLLTLLPLLWMLLSLPGCLSEQNFPPRVDRLVHVANVDRLPTRAWTARVHRAAMALLPDGGEDVLTTDQLAARTDAHGAVVPTDVWKHFDLNPTHLDDLFVNLRAIEQTAQTVSPAVGVANGRMLRSVWEGYHEIELPVNGVTLYARVGVPDKPYEIPGSWIIFTHGLFGTLDGNDVMNHVETLRRAGHHVLALELRGHGQTQLSHPEYAITFGLEESGDLLAAARWLKQTQGATRVGLISFSLTGVESLLTAWLDGRAPPIELQRLRLYSLLPPRRPEPAFNGGIMVISAPVGVLDAAKGFDTRYTLLESPVKATFQAHVAQRLALYKDGEGYSMWDLVRCEYPRSAVSKLYASFDAARKDMETFLDLSRDHWRVGASRMENVRVPLLVLNAANDPLGSAQGVADLFSQQRNPNIGVILTREGGHIGYSAYDVDYYYSLILNFFGPDTAPIAVE